MKTQDQISIECMVQEISGDPNSIVALDAEKVRRVTEGDSDPEFVTVVLESGMSKNKREWTHDVLVSMAKQVNSEQPVAYLGHIKDVDDPYVLPPPQTIWLGATTTIDATGTKLFVKGYNLPGSDVRDKGLVKKGAINSVSPRGQAALEPIKGGYRVVEFDMESIDWSRKGKSGLNARVASITREMEGDSVDPKEIAALSEADIRQHNSAVVELIETKALSANKEKISEMEAAIEASKPDTDLIGKIREALGIDDKANPLDALVKIMDAVEGAAKDKAKAIVSKVIAEKIPDNERAQSIALRLVGEMECNGDFDAFEREVSDKVDTLLKDDDDLKFIVTEMKGGSFTGGANIPGRQTSGANGGSNNDNDGKKDNENLAYEEVSV